MRCWVPGLVLLALLMGTAAADVGYYCADDASFHNWTIDGEGHNITEPCRFGCIEESGLCRDEPQDLGFLTAVVLAYIGIAFIMAYLAMNVDRKEHGILQILFMILSLYGVWATLGTVKVILEVGGVFALDPLMNNVLTVWIWGTILFIFYVIVFFLWNLISMVRFKKSGRRDGLKPLKTEVL